MPSRTLTIKEGHTLKIEDGATAVLNSSTNGIDFTGTTPGTNTDGSLIKAGTNSSRLAFSTPGQRGIALFFDNTAISGTFTGIRLRAGINPASGSNGADVLLVQASVESGKDGDAVNPGFIEFIPKGNNAVATARVLLLNADSAAGYTGTDHMILHVRKHTRDDETITNKTMIKIENEAVGGDGLEQDSFIQFVPTAMSGGVKAATYLLDGGTSTTLLGTAVMRLPDDGTVVDSTNAGPASAMLRSDITGYFAMLAGATTVYVPFSTTKPSDWSG